MAVAEAEAVSEGALAVSKNDMVRDGRANAPSSSVSPSSRQKLRSRRDTSQSRSQARSQWTVGAVLSTRGSGILSSAGMFASREYERRAAVEQWPIGWTYSSSSRRLAANKSARTADGRATVPIDSRLTHSSRKGWMRIAEKAARDDAALEAHARTHRACHALGFALGFVPRPARAGPLHGAWRGRSGWRRARGGV